MTWKRMGVGGESRAVVGQSEDPFEFRWMGFVDGLAMVMREKTMSWVNLRWGRFGGCTRSFTKMESLEVGVAGTPQLCSAVCVADNSTRRWLLMPPWADSAVAAVAISVPTTAHAYKNPSFFSFTLCLGFKYILDTGGPTKWSRDFSSSLGVLFFDRLHSFLQMCVIPN